MDLESEPADALDVLSYSVLPTPDGNEGHFLISASDPTRGEVIVTHRGIAGNRPHQYDNNLALWTTALPNLEAACEPLRTQMLSSNNQPDRVVFKYAFRPTDYSLTYQVGSSPTAMCALTSLSLFPEAMSAVPSNVFLEIQSVSSEYVEVRYTVLPGYQPKKYGNWIGIWGGYTIPYGSPPPLGRSKIRSFQSEDVVTIDDLALRAGSTYTLIYFMQRAKDDPKRSAAGAMLCFSV